MGVTADLTRLLRELLRTSRFTTGKELRIMAVTSANTGSDEANLNKVPLLLELYCFQQETKPSFPSY